MNLKSLSTALVALTLPLTVIAGPKLEAGTYNIDPMHSKIGFEVPHLVISTVEGRFTKYEGKIVVDKKIENSKVDVSIDVASINTSEAKRDDHLKSPDFFDVAKYPKMTFVSKKVSQTGDNLKVTGTLTLKGIAKEVTFDAAYLGTVKDGYGQDKAAFKGKTKINRKDYGLTWNMAVEAGPVVGDDVEIEFNIQAAKAK